MVIINHNAKTGVVVKHGHKLVHCVLMDSSGITVTRVPEEEFAIDWRQLDYSTKEAAKRLMSAGEKFGITQTAKDGLKQLLSA